MRPGIHTASTAGPRLRRLLSAFFPQADRSRSDTFHTLSTPCAAGFHRDSTRFPPSAWPYSTGIPQMIHSPRRGSGQLDWKRRPAGLRGERARPFPPDFTPHSTAFPQAAPGFSTLFSTPGESFPEGFPQGLPQRLRRLPQLDPQRQPASFHGHARRRRFLVYRGVAPRQRGTAGSSGRTVHRESTSGGRYSSRDPHLRAGDPQAFHVDVVYLPQAAAGFRRFLHTPSTAGRASDG